MNKSIATFSLESEYQELLRKIAELEQRTMTQTVRIMIDHKALALGLEPVRKFPAATNGT